MADEVKSGDPSVLKVGGSVSGLAGPVSGVVREAARQVIVPDPLADHPSGRGATEKPIEVLKSEASSEVLASHAEKVLDRLVAMSDWRQWPHERHIRQMLGWTWLSDLCVLWHRHTRGKEQMIGMPAATPVEHREPAPEVQASGGSGAGGSGEVIGGGGGACC